MIIYRVGHGTATFDSFPSGPYTCDGLDPASVTRLWGMAGDHSDGEHLSPYSDPALQGIGAGERCGFDSLDALNTWFAGWTEALAECGFIVYTYDVPDEHVRVGRNGQAVFLAREAVERDRHEFKPEQLSLFN